HIRHGKKPWCGLAGIRSSRASAVGALLFRPSSCVAMGQRHTRSECCGGCGRISEPEMNRREFIERAGGAAAAMSLLVGEGMAQRVAPSDQINLGIIGPGSRGQQLMRTFLRVPGVRFAGICDIYEPRFVQARKITAENTPIYRDHRALLEAHDIYAVIVATPLGTHCD